MCRQPRSQVDRNGVLHFDAVEEMVQNSLPMGCNAILISKKTVGYLQHHSITSVLKIHGKMYHLELV